MQKQSELLAIFVPEPKRADGMTARKIVIQDCGECPRSDHKGAFALAFRVPVCRKADRELPWTHIANRAGFVSAKREPGIPDWCPLPKDWDSAAQIWRDMD